MHHRLLILSHQVLLPANFEPPSSAARWQQPSSTLL